MSAGGKPLARGSQLLQFTCAFACLVPKQKTMAGSQDLTTRVLRSATCSELLPTKDYIGRPTSQVPQGKLPSIRCVLRVEAWHRFQPGCSKKPISAFSCKRTGGSKKRICDEEGGCVSSGNLCLMKKITMPFLQAGFSIQIDDNIAKKLKAIKADYDHHLKYIGRETDSAKKTREAYDEAIGKTFHIVHKDARSFIENDTKRTARAKAEDLHYYDDYFGDQATRTMMFSSRDKQYDISVDAEAARERRAQERKERERVLRERENRRLEEERNNNVQSFSHNSEGGDERCGEEGEQSGREDDEEGASEQWEGSQAISKSRYRRSRRRKDGGDGGGSGDDSDGEDGEVGRIPHEILKVTTPVAVRMNVSVEQHLCLTAAFLQASDVDIEKYPLSHTTAFRRRKEVLSEQYQEIRERFAEEMEENDDMLFVHLDTKALTDTIGPEGAAVNHTR